MQINILESWFKLFCVISSLVRLTTFNGEVGLKTFLFQLLLSLPVCTLSTIFVSFTVNMPAVPFLCLWLQIVSSTAIDHVHHTCTSNDRYHEGLHEVIENAALPRGYADFAISRTSCKYQTFL